ncbi:MULTISPECIES: SseB family protein [unclassified Kitasatospora]|uniref:SseB family protein n=1 Tax=unclassified Kitasatospora TaxID=2633591 RepID=UPI000709A43B|nr:MULTISPECIES: SseB family protein [unclassified Kitasatospora]KQV14593.1 hypothetical protein ASC99_31045 [Kitasatospora sp. Root107]KRB68133.1 hypothetical protein ASE03_29755 [Kitasatospora sp. Root187]
MTLDAALAELIEQSDSAAAMERVVRTLVAEGVFVPVHPDGTLYYLTHKDGTAALQICTTAAAVQHVEGAADTFYADALRLLEVVREIGARRLLVTSSDGWRIEVPASRLFGTVSEHGIPGKGQMIRLTWSTHPLAVALRDSVFRRLREFPDIHCVWVSWARWLDTGHEQLMVHMAVSDELPSLAAKRLMDVLLTQEITLGDADPSLTMLALHRVTHADSIAGLDRNGLDTIRIDHSTGRIELISREYDDPAAAEAARRALADQQQRDAWPDAEQAQQVGQRPRRWWQRS